MSNLFIIFVYLSIQISISIQLISLDTVLKFICLSDQISIELSAVHMKHSNLGLKVKSVDSRPSLPDWTDFICDVLFKVSIFISLLTIMDWSTTHGT